MPGKIFTIATCNLFNLNCPGLPIYNNSDGLTQELYEKKVSWTKRQIVELEADVWGFQELWHEDALRDIFDHPNLGDYTKIAPPGHQGQKIVCGGAVRTDMLVGEPEWIENFPEGFLLRSRGDDPQTSEISVQIDSFSRPVLHFKIKPRSNGKQISVLVAHLKSKGPTKVFREGWYREDTEFYQPHSSNFGAAISTIRRTAEASALRMILTDLMKGTDTPIIVLGDLNDGVGSNTLNIITEQPRYLVGVDSRGGRDTALYTTNRLQQYRSDRDVYYTHIFQDTRESLDHIVVSEQFYDHSRKREWIFRGMTVHNDHLNSESFEETIGSTDHGIVVVKFEYKPAKK